MEDIKYLIKKTVEYIKELDPECLPYTELDCDGKSELNMEKFAEEIESFMKDTAGIY